MSAVLDIAGERTIIPQAAGEASIDTSPALGYLTFRDTPLRTGSKGVQSCLLLSSHLKSDVQCPSLRELRRFRMRSQPRGMKSPVPTFSRSYWIAPLSRDNGGHWLNEYQVL